jgi:predicted NBD/HSP70 family sugar kinase
MANRLTGKPQLNRFVNRRLILDRIRMVGEISRAELAKQTAIRPPTVSAIIKELIDEGLVEEVGAGETSGGRAPRLLALSGRRLRALGLEMSESSIFAGLCDLNGELCAQMETPFKPVTPAEAVEQLHQVGSELLRRSGLDWPVLQGVGVALPGHLNAELGHVRWTKAFNWRDVSLKSLCEARWGVATDVVNDSLAGGMASHLFDVEKSINNLVFLYLRFQDVAAGVVGVGVGIIINGAPYHGEFGSAGEITTPIKHPLAHAAEAGAERYATLEALVDALNRSNASARAAMESVATELSTLVIHIFNLLEPGVLIVGTDTPPLRDWLLDRLEEFVQRRRLPHQAGKTRLMASALGKYGVARGAVVPTLHRLFRIPHWS